MQQAMQVRFIAIFPAHIPIFKALRLIKMEGESCYASVVSVQTPVYITFVFP